MATEKDNHWSPDYTEVLKKITTTEEMIDYHDKGADTYEEVAAKDWKGYESLAQAFFSLKLPKSVRILEIGPGTGIMGRILHEHGYTNLDGLDGSAKMLEHARATGAYDKLWQHIVKMGEPFPEDCKDYDVVLLSGVVFHLCISFNDLRHVVKVLVQGGIIGFNVIIEPTPELSEEFTEEGIHRNVALLKADGTLEPLPDLYPLRFDSIVGPKCGEVYFARVN